MPEQILTVLEAHPSGPKAPTKGVLEIVDAHALEATAHRFSGHLGQTIRCAYPGALPRRVVHVANRLRLSLLELTYEHELPMLSTQALYHRQRNAVQNDEALLAVLDLLGWYKKDRRFELGVWCANIRSRSDGRESVLVMQSAKNGLGEDSVRFLAAVTGIGD